MELKCVQVMFPVMCFASFNRTFMELKCVQVMFPVMCFASFNRTFMELKLVYQNARKVIKGGF